jgi:hypothetical protein
MLCRSNSPQNPDIIKKLHFRDGFQTWAQINLAKVSVVFAANACTAVSGREKRRGHPVRRGRNGGPAPEYLQNRSPSGAGGIKTAPLKRVPGPSSTRVQIGRRTQNGPA